jgi:(p)ppGpp synthase/HD superfamily hydrolase
MTTNGNSNKKKPKLPAYSKLNLNYEEKLLKYLLERLPEMSEEQKKFVIKAFSVAYKAHSKQKRNSGEPYIVHPVEVAIIVGKEIGFGPTSIAAALLHDVVEDTRNLPPEERVTLEDIERDFGREVKIIIDGVTKIKQESGTKQSLQVETFRNMIFRIAEDFRVLVIKIADRLHNMRTMEGMAENTQRIKSIENLEIYAKLAESAGFWNIKMELEDLSFRYLEPINYNFVKKASKKYDKKLKENIEVFQEALNSVIPRYLPTETVIVRRSLYSIWRKMTKENIGYENVSNIFSIRVVIDVQDSRIRKIAYDYYIDITNEFAVKNQSLRDFIIAPKPNGFKALVFNVMSNGHWREIQILSKEGHEIATYGFVKKKKIVAPGIFRIKEEAHRIENETPDYLLARFQELINPSQIRVFTPKGDLKYIVKGATVADFAFKIHSDLALHCKGARINESKDIFPPNYVLQKSQQVEIIVSEDIEMNESWLDFVKLPELKRFIIKTLNVTEADDEDKVYNPNLDFNKRKLVIIDDKVDYKLASCCMPLYGEPIMVLRKKNNMLIVHSENCHNANELRLKNAENTAKADWGAIANNKSRKVKILVRGYSKKGVLKEIINVVSDKMQLNMAQINLSENNGIFEGEITLFLWDYETLNLLINNIKNVKEIIDVQRILKKN